MGSSGSETAIKLEDVVVSINGALILDHLSLDVVRGEILGLVGASGGGKSVLLRTLLGLIPKSSGRIEIFGVDRDHATTEDMRVLERRWGVLFQQGALFSSLTVFQNIEFPMIEYLDISPRLRREVATAKLEIVGLAPSDGEKYPAALSGGMTKRVALARALALDPEIVFLDEPTSGLDPIASGEFNSLIRTLQRTLGITVFMVTHDLRGLMTDCDRIAALADGEIVVTGSIDTMLSAQNPWVRAYFDAARTSPPGRDVAREAR